MSETCKSTPVSWLELERFHLGEVAALDRARIASHLAECAVCGSCLAQITADARTLAPLPAILPQPRVRSPLRFVGGGVAIAASFLAAALLWSRPSHPPSRVSIKGGELAIALVVKRGESIVSDPARYFSGDAVKVLVTCPPGMDGAYEVEVFQDGERSNPLSFENASITCGNRVPIPGAFTLSGRGRATICVQLGGARACTTLDPAIQGR